MFLLSIVMFANYIHMYMYILYLDKGNFYKYVPQNSLFFLIYLFLTIVFTCYIYIYILEMPSYMYIYIYILVFITR